MILDIFNKDFERVGNISTPIFVQYTKKFCGIGTFNLNVELTEELKKYLVEDSLIQFDENVIGIIRYTKVSSEEQNVMNVKGYMTTYYLTYRYLERDFVTSGSTYPIQNPIITLCIRMFRPLEETEGYTLPDRGDERILVAGYNSSLPDNNPFFNYPVEAGAGESLDDIIFPLLGVKEMGIDFIPRIETNIESFTITPLAGTDRTLDNTQGNDPVAFSISLGNVLRFEYEEDAEKEANTAITSVDELDEPVVLSSGETGLNRKEIYLKLDLPEKGSSSDSKYRGVIEDKLKIALTDYRLSQNISATVRDHQFYEYEKDYFLGDFVTFFDESFDIAVNVQLTEITKTLDRTGEVLDFTFGWNKMNAVRRYNRHYK